MRVRPPWVAAMAGAAWGLAGYLLLWGATPIVVHRPFVVSLPGTLLLAPVRLVLVGIRLIEERVAHRSFDFSSNHSWIGVLAALVGAALAVVLYVVGRAVWRAVSRTRTATAGPAR
ncbi:MAG TPA: hypothetical protein VHH92_04575 [Actinomycetota bacterium]|nr:hypothetical protein [Actinomycetota bacterium]